MLIANAWSKTFLFVLRVEYVIFTVFTAQRIKICVHKYELSSVDTNGDGARRASVDMHGKGSPQAEGSSPL